VDCDDRLFVAESGANRVLVYDIWSERLLRRAILAGPNAPGPVPLDLAATARTVYLVTQNPAGFYQMTARRGPDPLPLDAAITAPSRIAVSPSGALVILDHAATSEAKVYPLNSIADAFSVPFATDVEFLDETTLVVARQPGADFLRFSIAAGEIEQIQPLKARGYDGLGIVRLTVPQPGIGYWSATGFRVAVAARVDYSKEGTVVTYRLDSGEFQTWWGRLFLDACIPEGTDVHVGFITLDEIPEDDPPISRDPPAKLIHEVVFRPDLSPTMPPQSLVPHDDSGLHPLHERESGRELPWAQMAPSDPFATYEAPIVGPAGRYLWVILKLIGNTKLTPRVRCLRAEHPSHDYVRRLPKTFSRDDSVADFLNRYLAIFEGFLGEAEARSAARESLLLPWATPDELLPWLASFVGLAFDERWSNTARRTFVEEAVGLFRLRGSLATLTRMIEIAIGIRPILIEHFRLRGIGGAVVGAAGTEFSNSVVGAFRIGGEVGHAGETPLSGKIADAFRVHAHRFTVIVPASLTTDQMEMVRYLLDAHRPAHTLYDVCTVNAGMQVGNSLYLGLSSVIGRTGGFTPLQMGGVAIGRGTVIGRPEAGTFLDASQLGRDTRVN
jgi:phage tail-like protein